MNRVLTWDFPVRLFHWTLALGLAIAFVIAKVIDIDDPIFGYHSLIGLVLLAMVALRLVWGVVGKRHARLRALPLSPRSLLLYAGAVLGRARVHHAGHNPATAWMMLLMFALISLVATTGLLSAWGIEGMIDLHELAVNALVVLSLLHIVGVALHTWRYRENIALGMITGRKANAPSDAIETASPLAAVAMLLSVTLLTVALARNYDPATRTTALPGVGTIPIGLGEIEEEE